MTLPAVDHIRFRPKAKSASFSRHSAEATDMEFNKIAGAILVTLLVMMGIGKIGNTLVPQYYPPEDKPGTTAPDTTQPAEKEKPIEERLAIAKVEDGERRAQQCVSCHTFDKGGRNGQGPNLWDIVGRKKASAQGFAYSPAMAAATGEWTFEQLDRYIADPAAVVPGNRMTFKLPNPDRRAEVIRFLMTKSDNPKALPAKQ
jgi:cytochrome c